MQREALCKTGENFPRIISTFETSLQNDVLDRSKQRRFKSSYQLTEDLLPRSS